MISCDVVGMTPEECVSRREALNRLKLKSLPIESSPVQLFEDKAVRRTSRSFIERSVVSLGGPAPLTPGRRNSTQVCCLHYVHVCECVE